MKTIFNRLLLRYILAAGLAAVVVSGCQTVGRDARQADGRSQNVVSAAAAGPAAAAVPAGGTKELAKPESAVHTLSGHAESMPRAEAMNAPVPSPSPGPEYKGERVSARPKRRVVVPMGDGPAETYVRTVLPMMKVQSSVPVDSMVQYYQDFGRDRFGHKDVNPVKLVSEEPVSTFSVDVDTASYSFVRKSLNTGHLPPKDSVRVEEMVNYFDYGYETTRDRKRPFKPNVAVYPTPWNPDTLLLHIGIKGLEPPKDRHPRANLVFLLDVSGSMNAPDKLPLVQSSMRMLLDILGPDDTVAIVVYAGAAGTVLEPTRVRDRQKILNAIDRLRAGGSTSGAEGIRQAYALARSNYDDDAVNRVILATDGDFNVGITNIEELKGFVERERESGIYLSVLGFGIGNYNDELMQALAQNGNGNAAYIDTLNEARKVLVDESASTLFPIARDVKIQVEFNPKRVAEYRLIGYETRMLRREDFNNDKVDAGDVGCGHTVTALYEITPVESPDRLIDELRYMEHPASGPRKSGEYAFLKIRYKLPKEDQSRLMVTPVTEKYLYRKVSEVPADMRFAAAVAAFGQMLRGGTYTGEFGYDDVLELAAHARGDDPFGYRSEFLNMVRTAKSSPSMASMR